MSVEAALKTRVLAITALAAIISNRFHQEFASRSTKRAYEIDGSAYGVFQQISDPGISHLGGAAGIASTEFQLDFYTRDVDVRSSMRDALHDGLNGFRGTVSGVDIRVINFDNRGRMSAEEPEDGRSSPDFRLSIDITVWHRIAVPTLA